MTNRLTTAVLGAGALGAAMAARLGEMDHEVRLWNRTAERAQSAAAGAPGVSAVTPVGEAVAGASVVITVLHDGDAVAQVMSEAITEVGLGRSGYRPAPSGPRVPMSWPSWRSEHGVAYLDAPVSGSTTPARSGSLVWLVAGDADALNRARPVLEDLGSSILHVGTDVEGSSFKLAVNAWMAASTVAMSDVLALCDSLGIPHEAFVDALEAGPLRWPMCCRK